MSNEIYKRYRPRTLGDVVGQASAIASLRKAMENNDVPHSMLFSGPSGTGKTTLVRILRRFLKCSRNDYEELNMANFRGIDTVRDIQRNVTLRPLGGQCRVYLIDEAHKMTNDAQNAMLKMLEDTPDHAYFFLATTDPQKLIAPILTRCTEVKLIPLKDEHVKSLLSRVAKEEKMTIENDMLDEIVEAAGGSARKALVLLETVGRLTGRDEQKKALQHTTLNKDLSFKLAMAVVHKGWKESKGWHKADWNDVAGLLRELENDDAESIRYVILGMARSSLIGPKTGGPPKNPMRGAVVIELFENHFYDSKHPGLALACFKAFNQK